MCLKPSRYSSIAVKPQVRRAKRIGRPMVHDVARTAGVSRATVDRVLNARAALDPDDLAGVAVMATPIAELRDAAARLRRVGLSVSALVSNQPDTVRDRFVGIDNDAAGRLMGLFLLRGAVPVLFVTSSIRARDRLERRFGFDTLRAAEFPGLDVLPTLEAHDDPDRMARIIATAFAARPEIAGVCSLSSRNGALLAALALQPGPCVVIAHELTPPSCAALLDGRIDAVITHDTGHLVRSAIRVLQARCDGRDNVASQERIRIEIILRENLP